MGPGVSPPLHPFDQSIDEILNGELWYGASRVYNGGDRQRHVEKARQRNIFHTAATSPRGTSGGPLVNSRGEVGGHNTWALTEEDEGAFVTFPLRRTGSWISPQGGISPKISAHAEQSSEKSPSPPSCTVPAPRENPPEGRFPNRERPADLRPARGTRKPNSRGGHVLRGEDSEGSAKAVEWLTKGSAEESAGAKALIA